MTSRSNKAEVRNPVLSLPSSTRFAQLDNETRATLEVLLRDLSSDARKRADTCWRKHKGPMAVYWKAVAVYSRHIAQAVKRGQG